MTKTFFFLILKMAQQMAMVASGNTKPEATKNKHYHYQLTLNEPDRYEKLSGYIQNLKSLNYFISCKEVAPTTGHEHIHIYCQFKTPIRLSVKKCEGAHIESCRGTPQDNQEYIKKDGQLIEEIGTMRKWGGLPTIAETKDATDDQLETLPIQYYNIVKQIKQERKGKRYYKEPVVHWLYGSTGKGKTKTAFEAGAENVIYNNGFFSDWGDARIISIEEMRGQIPFDELLKLTDGYHNYYFVNIKGGQKYIDLDEIFITSPKSPEACYPNKTADDSIKQLLRRITDITNLDA